MATGLSRAAEIHGRLEELVTGELDERTVEEVLRRRAAEVAGQSESDHEAGVHSHVVVVRRGRALLGLPIDRCDEVDRVDVCPLPHRTDIVTGLFLLRGHVHCLVDLLPLVDPRSRAEPLERALTILVHGEEGALGLLVDEVLGARQVLKREIESTSSAQLLHDFVVASTLDGLALLDLDLLLSRPELVLDAAL